jgi:hypothetical protein
MVKLTQNFHSGAAQYVKITLESLSFPFLRLNLSEDILESGHAISKILGFRAWINNYICEDTGGEWLDKNFLIQFHNRDPETYGGLHMFSFVKSELGLSNINGFAKIGPNSDLSAFDPVEDAELIASFPDVEIEILIDDHLFNSMLDLVKISNTSLGQLTVELKMYVVANKKIFLNLYDVPFQNGDVIGLSLVGISSGTDVKLLSQIADAKKNESRS